MKKLFFLVLCFLFTKIIYPQLAIYFSNNISKNFLIGYSGGVNIIKDGESNAFLIFFIEWKYI